MINYNEKIKKTLEPLPLLPELEFIHGEIVSCEYRVVKFNDEIQYYMNKDGSTSNNPKKEFYMVIDLYDFQMPNGKPRNQWINLGASFGEKSNLPKVLAMLGFNNDDPTAEDICKFFKNRSIKFHLSNKIGDDKKIRQKVLLETIRNSERRQTNKQTINPEDIAWEN